MKSGAQVFLKAWQLIATFCCLYIVSVSATAAQTSSNKTILSYPTFGATTDVATIITHASAFHNRVESESEATPIVTAWKTQQVTLPWTRLMLGRFIKHKISPSRAARGSALVHVAMHDALILAQRKKTSEQAAVSVAAATALGYLFPAEEKAFDRIAATALWMTLPQGAQELPPSMQQGVILGRQVGEALTAYGEADGAARGWNGERLQWYGEGRYYGPGTWEPTPPYYYYPPDEPFAPTWRTWALKSPGEFRPVPPVFGSPKYVKDLKEVVAVGAALTPEQLKVAKFWVDGKGSVTPPGHWNQIALDLMQNSSFDNRQAAEIFVTLNMAEADSFIASWDAKYHYWTVRPITAAKQLLGIDFKTAILTPPFPSYVSGHATFSGAAAQILGAYFPAEAKRLRGMGEEAALSRLYGGIHFRHDNEDGLVLGRKIADTVLTRYGNGIKYVAK